MENFDRVILTSLTVGVWCLIGVILFKPSEPAVLAHDSCTGWGEIEELAVGGDVYIYSLSC